MSYYCIYCFNPSYSCHTSITDRLIHAHFYIMMISAGSREMYLHSSGE